MNKIDKQLTDKFTLAASMVAAAIAECPILADNSGQLFTDALNIIIYESRQRAKARKQRAKRGRSEQVRAGGFFGALFNAPVYPSKSELQERMKAFAANRTAYYRRDREIADLHRQATEGYEKAQAARDEAEKGSL